MVYQNSSNSYVTDKIKSAASEKMPSCYDGCLRNKNLTVLGNMALRTIEKH